MDKRISLFKDLDLPDAFGVILLVLSLILALAPYFSGADFGVFKIPLFTGVAKKWLRILGPVLFVVCVLIFVPIFKVRNSDQEPSTNVLPELSSTNAASGRSTDNEQTGSSSGVKKSTESDKGSNQREAANQLQSQPKKQRIELTRLEAEDIIQRNRGDIERCISRLEVSYYYLDFYFSYRDDGGLNVNIYPGEEANDALEFMHPALKAQEVVGLDKQTIKDRARDQKKLSVIAPSANNCIIGSIKGDLRDYFLDDDKPFIHRYITDAGGGIRVNRARRKARSR